MTDMTKSEIAMAPRTLRRVLVVDDHPVVRAGLKSILNTADRTVVVEEVGTALDLLRQLRAEQWDVVLLDMSLPDRSSLDVLKQLRSRCPELPVLVFAIYAEVEEVARALSAGARGCLFKEGTTEEVMVALAKVSSGDRWVPAAFAQRLALRSVFRSTPDGEPHSKLSDREFEVLRMIACGLRNKEIAHKLCLSVKTISSHRARLLTKMGMSNNADLVRYALRNGLLDRSVEETGYGRLAG